MVSKSIVIKAPIQVVYQTIVDFVSYPEFLNDIKNAKVDWCDDKKMDVSFNLHLIKEIHYTLQIALKPPREISWKLKKSDLLKKNDGSWRLKSLDKNLTEALYALDVELGLWVPKSITESLMEKTLPATLKAFKKQSEKNFKSI